MSLGTRQGVPEGNLDDNTAARRRAALKEALLGNQQLVVNNDGQVTTPTVEFRGSGATPSTEGIQVPKGKLAAYQWYQQDPELLQEERDAMAKFFPEFELEAMDNGQLAWTGSILRPIAQNGQDRWHLQVIYDSNHPHNNTYGGSVRVYSILPDLDELHAKIGPIPHVLTDSKGLKYICTARMQDVLVGSNDREQYSTSAAVCLSWACKWITTFELWTDGTITDEQFSKHDNI